jgi:hypothetical protein
MIENNVFGPTHDPGRSLIVRFPGRHTCGVLVFYEIKEKQRERTEQL